MKEIEYDGFITREEDLMKSEAHFYATDFGKGTITKHRVDESKAKPITECVYPVCEECEKYVDGFCTVPMVVSKQNYIIINDKIDDLMKRVLDLENLVMDKILGDKDTVRIDHDGWHKQVVLGEELWCRDGAHIEVHDGIKYMVGDEE